MLEGLFTKLLYMSIQASLFILVILLIRVSFRKMPRKYICMLWCLAALRLMLPVTVESRFSLMPGTGELEETVTELMNGAFINMEPLSGEFVNGELISGQLVSGEPAEGNAALNGTQISNAGGISAVENTDAGIGSSANPIDSESGQALPVSKNSSEMSAEDQIKQAGLLLTRSALRSRIAALSWMTGAAGLLLYGLYSYLKVKAQVREAVHETDNIWLSDRVETPFLLGCVRPRIYLPFSVREEDRSYVIAHERAHISRGDHVSKLIGYLLLAVYWFQPLVWVAYILFCRDVEMACDEKVVALYGTEQKKRYSETLLHCSVDRHALLSNPLAFGEIDVKKRIGNVLHYKKPQLWLAGISLIVLGAAGLLFMTSRGSREEAAAEDPSRKWLQNDNEIFIARDAKDLTHDGVLDAIVFAVSPRAELGEGLSEDIDDYRDMSVEALFEEAFGEGHVYVYKGIDNFGSYESTPIWSMDGIGITRIENAQVSVVTRDAQDYLLVSSMEDVCEAVGYSYRVFSLSDSGEENVVYADAVDFHHSKLNYGVEAMEAGDLLEDTYDVETEEALKAFRDGLMEWLENATAIIITDVWADPVVFCTEDKDMDGNRVDPRLYYQQIWDKWLQEEVVPQTFGYQGYTGYLDQCRGWSYYDAFVDCDYDGDGLTDRVYRSEPQAKADAFLCDYQIEFGSGEMLLIEDAPSVGWPGIQAADMNGDGCNEILFGWEYIFSTNPSAFGEMALFEKKDGVYQEAQLPFTKDPENRWEQGLTLAYDFSIDKAEENHFRVTIQETGLEAELIYGADLGPWENLSELAPVYTSRFQEDKEGVSLFCQLGVLDKYCSDEVWAEVVYENGAYVFRNLDFVRNYSEFQPFADYDGQQYQLEITGPEYVASGRRTIAHVNVVYDEDNARHWTQSIEEENILECRLLAVTTDQGCDTLLCLTVLQGEEEVSVSYCWDEKERLFVKETVTN